MKSKPTARKKSGSEANPETAEADQKRLLEEAIQKREKLAESQLETSKFFLQNQKLDIARRRLREIVVEFEGSAAAAEAKALLKSLKS